MRPEKGLLRLVLGKPLLQSQSLHSLLKFECNGKSSDPFVKSGVLKESSSKQAVDALPIDFTQDCLSLFYESSGELVIRGEEMIKPRVH